MLSILIKQYENIFDYRSISLIDCFTKIEDDLIDWNRSYFIKKSDFVELYINAQNDCCYPIQLDLGIEKQKQKYFLSIGYKTNPFNIMYYEDYEDEELYLFTKEYILKYLKSNIVETIKKIDDEIVSIKIDGDQLKYDNGIIGPENLIKKIVWPWKRNRIIEEKKIFKPWIMFL